MLIKLEPEYHLVILCVNRKRALFHFFLANVCRGFVQYAADEDRKEMVESREQSLRWSPAAWPVWPGVSVYHHRPASAVVTLVPVGRNGMPNTLIREGFVDSEKVNNLDYDEECFYHRLLLRVDDAGRFDGRLDILRSILFPLGYKTHSDPVARGLDGCQREGLILCYVIADHPYIQVTNWKRRGNKKVSRCPGPDGTYEIRYVTMRTDRGPQEFVDTGVRSSDICRLVDSHLEVTTDGDGDGDGDGKTRSHPDGMPMASTSHPDGIPASPDDGVPPLGEGETMPTILPASVYERHPLLRVLHQCIYLRGITLEQYLMARKSRSRDMDFLAATQEVVRRAELDGKVDRPARFLDKEWSYWEKDHAAQIADRAEKRRIKNKEFHAIVDAMLKVGDEVQLERMKEEYRRVWGTERLERAERKAAKIKDEKDGPPPDSDVLPGNQP
jgi:hypothetical protein